MDVEIIEIFKQPLIEGRQLERTRTALGFSFQRIFGYLLEDGNSALSYIERAIREGNATHLVMPAHRLKGKALHFGALRLGRLSEYIEHHARQCVERRQSPAELAHYVARLRPMFEETMAEILRGTRASRLKSESLGIPFCADL